MIKVWIISDRWDASSVVEHSAFNRLAPSSTLGRPTITIDISQQSRGNHELPLLCILIYFAFSATIYTATGQRHHSLQIGQDRGCQTTRLDRVNFIYLRVYQHSQIFGKVSLVKNHNLSMLDRHRFYQRMEIES
jgi:hypothetical protein